MDALLLDQNDEEALRRRYMTLETPVEVGENPKTSLPAVTGRNRPLPDRSR